MNSRKEISLDDIPVSLCGSQPSRVYVSAQSWISTPKSTQELLTTKQKSAMKGTWFKVAFNIETVGIWILRVF